jgi:hypothetical protein
MFGQNNVVSCTVHKKKREKSQNGVVLNGTKDLLLPLDMQRQGKKKFISLATPLPLSLPHSHRKPRTTHTHTYPTTTMKNQESHAQPPYSTPRQWQGSHLTLLHDKGKVPLSPASYKYRGVTI